MLFSGDTAGRNVEVELQPLQLNPAHLNLNLLSGWLPNDTPQGFATLSAQAADALPDVSARLVAKARQLTPGQTWHISLKVSKTIFPLKGHKSIFVAIVIPSEQH